MLNKIKDFNKKVDVLTIHNIIEIVYEIMKNIENMKDIEDKNKELHKQLILILGSEIYEKNKLFIDCTCETVIFLSRKYNISINKKCLSSCVSNCFIRN